MIREEGTTIKWREEEERGVERRRGKGPVQVCYFIIIITIIILSYLGLR